MSLQRVTSSAFGIFGKPSSVSNSSLFCFPSLSHSHFSPRFSSSPSSPSFPSRFAALLRSPPTSSARTTGFLRQGFAPTPSRFRGTSSLSSPMYGGTTAVAASTISAAVHSTSHFSWGANWKLLVPGSLVLLGSLALSQLSTPEPRLSTERDREGETSILLADSASSTSSSSSWKDVATCAGVLGSALVIHELFHAAAAWIRNVGISELSIGVGPALAWIQSGEMLVSLRAVPIAAYVKFLDELQPSSSSSLPYTASRTAAATFRSPAMPYRLASPSSRSLIMLAGVVGNLCLALGALTWQVMTIGQLKTFHPSGLEVLSVSSSSRPSDTSCSSSPDSSFSYSSSNATGDVALKAGDFITHIGPVVLGGIQAVRSSQGQGGGNDGGSSRQQQSHANDNQTSIFSDDVYDYVSKLPENERSQIRVRILRPHRIGHELDGSCSSHQTSNHLPSSSPPCSSISLPASPPSTPLELLIPLGDVVEYDDLRVRHLRAIQTYVKPSSVVDVPRAAFEELVCWMHLIQENWACTLFGSDSRNPQAVGGGKGNNGVECSTDQYLALTSRDASKNHRAHPNNHNHLPIHPAVVVSSAAVKGEVVSSGSSGPTSASPSESSSSASSNAPTVIGPIGMIISGAKFLAQSGQADGSGHVPSATPLIDMMVQVNLQLALLNLLPLPALDGGKLLLTAVEALRGGGRVLPPSVEATAMAVSSAAMLVWLLGVSAKDVMHYAMA